MPHENKDLIDRETAETAETHRANNGDETGMKAPRVMKRGLAVRIERWSPGRWCWVAWMDGAKAQGALFATRRDAWDGMMAWALSQ